MKKFSWTVFALLLCGFLPAVSNGQLITIGIEAVVDNVTDNDNLLEGKVHIGSTITGTYTYDTSTPDTNPASDIGNYYHYVSPCGVNWSVGGFIFETDPTNVKFLIGIADNNPSHPGDGYWLSSYNNLPLENDVQISNVSWQLDDYGGTGYSD